MNYGLFLKVYKDNIEEGKQSVVKNEAWALLYFPQNFSAVLAERSESYLRPRLRPDELEFGQVHVYFDATGEYILFPLGI